MHFYHAQALSKLQLVKIILATDSMHPIPNLVMLDHRILDIYLKIKDNLLGPKKSNSWELFFFTLNKLWAYLVKVQKYSLTVLTPIAAKISFKTLRVSTL